MTMQISLSILEYENTLVNHLDNLAESKILLNIVKMIQEDMIQRIHIDVMRPPMISHKYAFSIEIIKQLYIELHKQTILELHLMVMHPFTLLEKINEFVPEKERGETFIILQRESFSSNYEAVNGMNRLRDYYYRTGISLNLLTPSKMLTETIIDRADMILLMAVPMGRGGQPYSKKATQRIEQFSQRFPEKILGVDGGINLRTIKIVQNAGAQIAVVGSYITANEKPFQAIEQLTRSFDPE